jgi:hypothetical protein
MNCASCNKGFSCGCQKTKAKDGNTVHKSCLSKYNSTLSVSSNKLTNTLNTAKSNLLK